MSNKTPARSKSVKSPVNTSKTSAKTNEIVQGAVLEAVKTGLIYNPHKKIYVDINSTEGQHVKGLLEACYTCKKPDYIYNVITGKCVRKKSKIGRKLQEYIDFCDDYAKEIVKYRPDDKKIIEAIKDIKLPKTQNGWYATQHRVGDIIDGIKEVKPTDIYFKNSFLNEIIITVMALVGIVGSNPSTAGYLKDKIISIFRHLNPSTAVTLIKAVALELDTGIIGKTLSKLKIKELYIFFVNTITSFIAVFRTKKPTNREATDNFKSNFHVFNYVSTKKGVEKEVQIEKNDLLTLNKLKSMQAISTKGNVNTVNLAKLRIADDKVKNAKSVAIKYDAIEDSYLVKVSNNIKTEVVDAAGTQTNKVTTNDRYISINLRKSVKQREQMLSSQLKDVKDNVSKLIRESTLELEDYKTQNTINEINGAKMELEERLREEEYLQLTDPNARKINRTINILKTKIKNLDQRMKILRSSIKSKTSWNFSRDQLNELQLLLERVSLQQKNLLNISQDNIEYNYEIMNMEFGSIRGSLDKLRRIDSSTFEFTNLPNQVPHGWKPALETLVEVSTSSQERSAIQHKTTLRNSSVKFKTPSTTPPGQAIQRKYSA